ncbi:transposase [Kitasatospora sp. NE20-6]|uniref:transposase n=1 Tax=Kitasatospora sp. NE20-6 TaxID=2859066 RepID=UPI0038B2ACA1
MESRSEGKLRVTVGKRCSYDAEFRAGAVRIVVETGKSAEEIARDLGAQTSTLQNWVHRARTRGGRRGDRKAERVRARRTAPDAGGERSLPRREQQTHYIAVIKGNHPTLQQELKQLPWQEVQLQDRGRATTHGRDEIRRIRPAPPRGLDFHLRRRRLLRAHRNRTSGHGRPSQPRRRRPPAMTTSLPGSATTPATRATRSPPSASRDRTGQIA